MSATTKIEWADRTWNPMIGCDRVSPGCDHCYAITTARIRSASPNPKVAAAFAGTVHRDVADRLDWTGTVNLLPDRLSEPLRWRKPAKVFVNSLSDLFHKDVPENFIARVFAVMAATPRHTYQVLTKRHGRMRSLLGRDDFPALVCDRWLDVARAGNSTWPLPNVWLGVSVEDQHWADIRIPALLATPAAVRFLSCEPLLGPVDLAPFMAFAETTLTMELRHRLQWVIAGGESGPGARPMHPDWARQLRKQCQDTGVPFFFKQWGAWRPLAGNECARAGDEWPAGTHDVMCRRVGKGAAGRELDGRTWDEYPAGAS